MEAMLRDWSQKSIEDEFQTFPKHGYSYIIPSRSNKDYTSSLWLQEHVTFTWKKFDDYSNWLYSGRLVTLPMMCSCQINLKTYVCKHAVGASIYYGLYIVSDLDKLESLGKRHGKPKKEGPALAR